MAAAPHLTELSASGTDGLPGLWLSPWDPQPHSAHFSFPLQTEQDDE